MKLVYLLIIALLLPLVSAHVGEETAGAEQPPLEALLQNPATLIGIGLIILGVIGIGYFYKTVKEYRKIMTICVLVAFTIIAVILLVNYGNQPAAYKPYHVHADFKVYLNGRAFNFSQEKYMSSNTSKLSEILHLHDMDGDILHQHAKGYTIGKFFETLNITFNSTCFVLGDSSYCNNDGDTLKMYVRPLNGEWSRNYQLEKYEFSDLDQILITYGNETENVLQKQKKSITDKACIQSEKCPERGKATDATCAGSTCAATQ